MQDFDDQQHSEKDIVQPEDISNASTEKCLENVGYEFEKYTLTTEPILFLGSVLGEPTPLATNQKKRQARMRWRQVNIAGQGGS
ncbi:hypothetical protein TNCV_3890001 [Trichonephila clavipes]|nr:hypothetical protein TNCV_3890001 [Trichonephila clavipes]